MVFVSAVLYVCGFQKIVGAWFSPCTFTWKKVNWSLPTFAHASPTDYPTSSNILIIY